MKLQLTKKLFAFIITIMMFSILPGIANAQKKCHNGNCPTGYTCIGGYCEPVMVICNCLKRPIPPECGQICGFYADPIHGHDMLSISDINSAAINLELIEDQNVTLKIYDITGRLIKTLVDTRLTQGEHQIEWNRTDETGNMVSSGTYVLQLDAGAYNSGTKKLLSLN